MKIPDNSTVTKTYLIACKTENAHPYVHVF